MNTQLLLLPLQPCISKVLWMFKFRMRSIGRSQNNQSFIENLERTLCPLEAFFWTTRNYLLFYNLQRWLCCKPTWLFSTMSSYWFWKYAWEVEGGVMFSLILMCSLNFRKEMCIKRFMHPYNKLQLSEINLPLQKEEHSAKGFSEVMVMPSYNVFLLENIKEEIK